MLFRGSLFDYLFTFSCRFPLSLPLDATPRFRTWSYDLGRTVKKLYEMSAAQEELRSQNRLGPSAIEVAVRQ